MSKAKGIFKGKERKVLTEQIQQAEQEIDRRLDKLPDILRENGYPDVQAFIATCREAEAVVEQYNRSLAEWERQVKEKSRADSRSHERNPLTGTAVRHRKTAAMVLPIIGGIHI